MSNPEVRTSKENPAVRALRRLEEVVGAAEARSLAAREELALARTQREEMSHLLKRFTGGQEDPARLVGRLRALEAENALLRERLQKGREGVERLLARIRFLEEQG